MIFGFFKKKGPAIELLPGEEAVIELHRETSEGVLDNAVLLTEVVESDAKSISFLAPTEHNRPVPFSPGEVIVIQVDKGENTAKFQSEVVELLEQVTPPLLVVAQPKSVGWGPKDVEAAQRRQFVRLEATLPLEFKTGAGVVRQGVTNDISGSGLSMVTAFPINVGSLVKVRLALPEKKIESSAKVVRCNQLQPQKFELALSFTDVSVTDQDTIVRYIFERQRELRRRGLI